MKTHLLPSALAYLLFPSSALFSPVSSATIQPVANLGRLRSDHSVECTEDTTWTAEQIPSKKNCAAAVAKVREEYDAFGTDEFEFLAPGTLPKSGRPLQKTPRKFQAGDCEVAIAMTKTFKPGTLPGKAPGRLPSDITTWEKIFNGYVLSELSRIFAYIIWDRRKRPGP